MIYTTNAIESINISSNKTIKICRSFLTTEDGDQAVLPYAMRPELLISKNTKVFFWNLYPDIFFPLVFPFNFIPKTIINNIKVYQLILNVFYKNTLTKVQKFVTEMNNCKALVFMDSSNLDRTNEILELKLKMEKVLKMPKVLTQLF